MLPQKSENTQSSDVNYKFFFKKLLETCTSCNHQAFVILVLFTEPFYHFLFSRYLDLTKHHFLSDISVPFPDQSDLYSHGTLQRIYFLSISHLATFFLQSLKVGSSVLISTIITQSHLLQTRYLNCLTEMIGKIQSLAVRSDQHQ